MKLRLLAASLAALTLVSGAAVAQDTTSERGKLSYAIGYNTGVELAELTARGEAVDLNTVIKAIQDAYACGADRAGRPVRGAVQGMQQRMEARAQEEFNRSPRPTMTQSDAYIVQYRSTAGGRRAGSTVQRVLENGPASVHAGQHRAAELRARCPTAPSGRYRPAAGRAAARSGDHAGQPDPAGRPAREALLQMPAGARWEILLPGDRPTAPT